MQKILINFGDLDPIFEVARSKKNVENALSALCLLKGWMDFNKICINISLGNGKELNKFW